MNPLVSAEFENNRAALEKETPEVTINTEAVPAETLNTTVTNPEPEKRVVAQPVVSSAAYYIITGSFQSEENAGKQVSQLQAEGFNPEVIKAANGFYRVCAVACPDLGTAISKKDSILDKFPGAWVSRKK
jgi:cell division protein FtsN